MPELESIVEPIGGEDESSVAGSADDSSFESEGAAVGEPHPEPEPQSGAAQASAPELVREPEKIEPELLEAIAPDRRLDVESIEKELLRLINSLRADVDENALGIEDSMQFAARIRAAEALEAFSHTRTDGTPYNTAFDEAGFSYAGKWHGENLSSLSFSPGTFNESEIALEMFKGLKNSPGHYRNMTEKNFLQAGVGVAVAYSDGNVDVASAQMFSSL